tara:strand:+ start:1465 stop:1941 length:477 start_codon:yes stop_codon:yes gene_type:complete
VSGRVAIHILGPGDQPPDYVATCADDTRDSVDRAAYMMAVEEGVVVTLGCVVATPLPPLRVWQRVYIDSPTDAVPDLRIYGIVELIGGVPEHTYCCSATPDVWVHVIGLDSSDTEAIDGAETLDGHYYHVGEVVRSLSGEPFEAADLDDAREEAQGNW